ncbi:PD-(D/E)XK nuclease family protein [Candidatus Woesebacteria bacterium]|nr:PD-(D/E)XK nuclease family protein [Candidatus Woesebacteria bacterium]
MKATIEFAAVIPTQQYGNIQPRITLTDIDIKEGTDIAQAYIEALSGQYSEKGAFVRKTSMVIGKPEKSFNEGIEINYDPIAHSYVFKGKTLVSATEYIDRFYKPFDSEAISKVSANAWGVEQESVKGVWDSNGDLTSAFGNVVHKALEHFDKYQAMGAMVQANKSLPENYALPKHPILKSIIEGFMAVNKTVGTPVTEAMISDVESGVCGRSDRILILDQEKKVCRVQDYKVNVNSEEVKSQNKALPPFADLPANKITKYQLQLSLYANMLQKSGWTVEGLDVFVYEDGWKHFELPVLKVI